MPTQHLLPPLNTDALPLPEAYGQWVAESDYEWLGTLAQCLGQQADGQTDEDLLSIPDVWAQAMVFESALLDTGHPLHRRSVREWRGLIGILALSAQRGLALRSRLVHVRAATVNSPSGTLFASVAHRLRPGSTLVEGQDWTSVGILTLGGRLLAMVVPHVLICPVRGHEQALDDAIEWRVPASGRLDDPLNAPNLTSEELGLVARYARSLQQRLHRLAGDGAPDRRLSQLLARFGDFREELENRARLTLSDVDVRPAPQQFELPAPLYSLVNGFEILVPRQRYDTAIVTRDEFRDVLSGVLLLDERLPGLLQTTASALRAWDSDTLETVLRHPNNRQRIVESSAQGGFLVIGIDQLFTPALCQLTEGAIATHGAAESFTLPLTPLALMLYSPAELRDRITIRPEDGGFRVILRVDLQNDRGDVRSCQLSRHYPRVHRASSPTSLSVWPNFRSEHWNYYYLFYGANPQESLTPSLPVTGSDLRAALNPLAPAAHRVNAAAQLAQRLETVIAEGKRRRMLDERSNLQEALVLMYEQPEAILCTVASAEAGGLRTRQPVGFILAAEAKQAAQRKPSSWRIGVDFGTTNTCIFQRRNGGAPERVTFRNRCISPFRGHESEKQAQVEHALEFLPLIDRPVPFQSVLQDRSNLPNEGMPRWPLWTERIYYVRDVQATLETLRGDANGSLRFDLKWSENPDDRTRRQEFLAQAAMEALAEAAAEGMDPAEVEWCFSYPEAFKGTQLSDYQGIIPMALRAAISSTPTELPLRIADPSPESVCAALYFHKHGVALTGTTVTFDVGGGTTDISIWQSRKLVWRSSVRFAGRDIVIDYLARQPEYVYGLTRQSQTLRDAYREFAKAMQETQRVFQGTEVFVNSDIFSRAFNQERAAVNGTAAAKGLHGTVEFAMAGLLYYVGMVYGALVGSEACRTDLGAIQICYGGRGSLMMRELVGTSVTSGMESLFNAAARFGGNSGIKDQHLSLSYSENPKEEVAFGLLMERADATDLEYRQEKPVESFIGEDIRMGDETILWNTSAAELKPTVEWRCGELRQLLRFVAHYQKIFGRNVQVGHDIPIGQGESVGSDIQVDHDVQVNPPRSHYIFDPVVKAHVSTQVTEALVAQRNQAAAASQTSRTMRIEPPFIIALRALNGYLNRNNKLIQ